MRKEYQKSLRKGNNGMEENIEEGYHPFSPCFFVVCLRGAVKGLLFLPAPWLRIRPCPLGSAATVPASTPPPGTPRCKFFLKVSFLHMSVLLVSPMSCVSCH